MGRKQATIGLVIAALLFASGTGAAQSLTGTVDSNGSANVDETVTTEHASEAEANLETGVPAVEQPPTQQVCPPGQMCAPGYEEGDEEESDADADVYLSSDAEVHVDLDGTLKMLPKAPEEGEANLAPPAEEEPEEQPTEETPPAPEDEPLEINDEIGGTYDGNGSIDHNASAEASATTEQFIETTPAPAPAEEEPEEESNETPVEEKPAPERTPLDLTAAASAFLQGCRESESQVQYLFELPAQTRIEAPAEQEPEEEPEDETPVEHDIEVGDGIDIGLSLRSAFEASTKGLTGAATQVGSTIEQLVGSLRGAFATQSTTELTSSVEAVGPVTGSADVTGNLAAEVENLVADVEVPEIAPPTVDVRSDSSVQSSTSVSTGVLGDVDLGL